MEINPFIFWYCLFSADHTKLERACMGKDLFQMLKQAVYNWIFKLLLEIRADGVMWSQLTVPLARQAMQIQLVFVNNVLFQIVSNNKLRKIF